MKILKFLITLSVILSVSSLFAQPKTSYKFDPTPGEISIAACSPIPYGVTPTRQSYVDLVDCGFNLGYLQESMNYFKEQFDLIGDLNFKYILSNGNPLGPQWENWIKTFRAYKQFAGWKFVDEPKYSSLQEYKSQFDKIRNKYPDVLVFMNLVGVLSRPFTGNNTNFAVYLDQIQAMFNPQIWSYDFYPIITRNGKTTCEYESFYYALECFSAQAKKTKKPFWAFCESMQYSTSDYSRPAATEAYLRYEAFSALAYGAQGIIYWTYGQRQPGLDENYLSALVNIDGKKTPAWYAAQKVNREIKKFNDVFCDCKVLEVRHTGDKIYKGTKKLSGEFGPLKMIRNKKAGVVVSHIENKGSRYVVIVNRDVFNSQKITLELKPNNDVIDLTNSGNTTYSWRKDISITLEKGGYIILKEIN